MQPGGGLHRHVRREGARQEPRELLRGWELVRRDAAVRTFARHSAAAIADSSGAGSGSMGISMNRSTPAETPTRLP
jgi:hypothetical protein